MKDICIYNNSDELPPLLLIYYSNVMLLMLLMENDTRRQELADGWDVICENSIDPAVVPGGRGYSPRDPAGIDIDASIPGIVHRTTRTVQ